MCSQRESATSTRTVDGVGSVFYREPSAQAGGSDQPHLLRECERASVVNESRWWPSTVRVARFACLFFLLDRRARKSFGVASTATARSWPSRRATPSRFRRQEAGSRRGPGASASPASTCEISSTTWSSSKRRTTYVTSGRGRREKATPRSRRRGIGVSCG